MTLGKLTPRQGEIVLEALEWHYKRTRNLRSMAGQRRYSTRDKHDETLAELRLLIGRLST